MRVLQNLKWMIDTGKSYKIYDLGKIMENMVWSKKLCPWIAGLASKNAAMRPDEISTEGARHTKKKHPLG